MQVGAVPSFRSLPLCSYPNRSYYYLQILTLLLFLFSCSVVSNSLQPHGLQDARLPCPPLSPGVCPSSCPFEEEKLKFYILLLPLSLSLLLAKSTSHRSQKVGTHNTRKWSLSHSPLSCSLQLPSPCKPANHLNHACLCIKTL